VLCADPALVPRAQLFFLALPVVLVLMGGSIWLGFDRTFGFIPASAERIGIDPRAIRTSSPWSFVSRKFRGLGREFMPPLDEGAFLWMPTTMPHASLGEVLEVMQHQDLAMASVPEVELAVGKLGRVESALDPAPVSMIETVIQYKPEYIEDAAGRRINFKYDRATGEYARDEDGELIPDRRGRPYRQWREHIRTPDDIWDEIVKAAHMTGTTSAPKLMPIETRQVMLQTGMRAPMGIKLRAPDLATLDRMIVELERHVRQVPGIREGTVNAERVVGKPYLEMVPDRAALSRYGLNIIDVQQAFSAAVGGMTVTTTVEGRERYPVRVRYPRELRNDIEDLERIQVAAPDGTQVPLMELAQIHFVRGAADDPQRGHVPHRLPHLRRGPGIRRGGCGGAGPGLPAGQDRCRRARRAAGRQLDLRRQLRAPASRRQDAQHRTAGAHC
jgi:copper/silver efflux system protein